MGYLNKILQIKYLVGAILFFFLAFIFEKEIRFHPDEEGEFIQVQQIIQAKTSKVDKLLSEIEQKLDSSSLDDLMNNESSWTNELYEKEGIVLLGYAGDSLKFWTNNAIPVENYTVDKQLYNDVVKLKSGWYIIRRNNIDNYKLFGLILLKNEYSYQNEFIKSEFFYEYEIDVPVSIDIDETEGFLIKDHKGKYLFSFKFNTNIIYNPFRILISSVFYFIALILLFLGLRNFIRTGSSSYVKNIYVVFLGILLLLLRFLMLKFQFPHVFKHLELFQPHHFAISLILPSLGDFLLNTFFIFFFFSVFYTEFTIKLPKQLYLKYAVVIVLIALSFAFFFYIHFSFESLIFHSSISFEVYRFFNLSIYSFVGFINITLLLSSMLLFIDKIFKSFKDEVGIKVFVLLFIPSLVIFTYFLTFFSFKLIAVPLVFYAFIMLYISYIRIYKRVYSFSVILIVLLASALYTVAFITLTSAQKDRETRKVLSVNLANEHDQIAEMLLEGIELEIEKDSIVRDLLTWHIQNEGTILEHLQMNYFSGYFRKYDLEISVCNPNDDLTLILENSTEIVHCYSFFKDLFAVDGMKLQNSRFYFLDKQNGEIRYVSQFVYKKPSWTNEVSLFISLKSKLVSQELGYPELLLDSRMGKSASLNEYSYAKYKAGNLMSKTGDFPYNLILPKQWQSDDEFCFVNDKNYEHLVYSLENNTAIVISHLRIRPIDALASFSYVFVFYYILYSLILFILHFPGNVKSFRYDFKNKMKFSMIGVLLLSLIIVGFGTIYYNINQFEKKLHESISEKIQSVLVELGHKLGGEFELNESYSDYLPYLLTKFSTVFNTDINLYDTNGNILASSRPQVFEKGLMGNKMNVDAYNEMVKYKRGKYIHKEIIGKMSYYSAYVPFTNDEGVLLAYLNLPYFTKQSVLKKEIYTIVVAVVNIYFFLILLSVVVAILVSNNITKPLRLIQERFRAIDLGKKNEPIDYTSNDEIGSLIKEYNRMVSELSENAEKLAKSERESAWREMAKQIAHEIKNPLTPMKLSVQYLQKAWKDNNPDFDKRLEKFSNSLISQINNLSSIATEFSNFAKMPRARAEQVDIIAKLTDSISLFENSEKVVFSTDFKGIDELLVYVDKEQILIVFSNLIQNAIQAIPKERKGEIKIAVEKLPEFMKIIISDNGTGIQDDVKDKLFIPNFTTKSSGMGLGLAIVKNIIENTGGEIWYETEVEDSINNTIGGTSFFITLPIYKQVE